MPKAVLRIKVNGIDASKYRKFAVVISRDDEKEKRYPAILDPDGYLMAKVYFPRKGSYLVMGVIQNKHYTTPQKVVIS